MTTEKSPVPNHAKSPVVIYKSYLSKTALLAGAIGCTPFAVADFLTGTKAELSRPRTKGPPTEAGTLQVLAIMGPD
jgi:hypothetical protein